MTDIILQFYHGVLVSELDDSKLHSHVTYLRLVIKYYLMLNQFNDLPHSMVRADSVWLWTHNVVSGY